MFNLQKEKQNKMTTKTVAIFFVIITALIASFPRAYSKIEPPNYDFSLDAFNKFAPGVTYDDIAKDYKPELVMENPDGTAVYKIYINHMRYVFPLFFQTYQKKIIDYIARLPSYFIHDIFHQSIINRYGKQNKYTKKENSAVYIWDNIQGTNKIIYSGSCTITCFPMYYALIPQNPPADIPKYVSSLDKLSDQVKKLPDQTIKPQ